MFILKEVPAKSEWDNIEVITGAVFYDNETGQVWLWYVILDRLTGRPHIKIE